jgi:hypothetical protein
MKFTGRELEVIGHALKNLADDVEEISKANHYTEYIREIKDIQTKITGVVPTYTLN